MELFTIIILAKIMIIIMDLFDFVCSSQLMVSQQQTLILKFFEYTECR